MQALQSVTGEMLRQPVFLPPKPQFVQQQTCAVHAPWTLLPLLPLAPQANQRQLEHDQRLHPPTQEVKYGKPLVCLPQTLEPAGSKGPSFK